MFFSFIYETRFGEKCSLIVCTSGSSGNPKLARISHLQQLQNYTWINDFDPDLFTFNMISPYWLSGLNCLTFQLLHGQKRLITAKPYTPELFIDLIEKYRISNAFLVPPLLSLLIDTPRFKEADLNSIKFFVTGGLYVSENLRRVVQEKLPNGVIKIGYGMTEFGGLLAVTPNDFKLSTSVGYPSLNTEIKIQLDDGTTGGIKEIGEILVRHPVQYLGYFKKSHKSIIDDEGWLHTSDMGFIDESHEVNIIGQRIFAIKNFYNEFFPSEVEEIIESVAGVKQVVIVGTPDPVEIELTTALVVLKENINLTEDVIFEATSGLPIYKQPRGGIFFLDALPMTCSGKIKRREAKELAAKLKFDRNITATN
jgi:4-coumarate--CoA ligase